MKYPRTATAIVALVVCAMAAGCECLGGHCRRTPQTIAAGPIAGDAPQTAAKETPAPAAWSSQARDVEKSVMRNTADPTWQR